MRIIPRSSQRTATVGTRAKGGFSLIEVTLALGIVAFAMVPLLALIPAGLNASHASMENTAFTQLVAQISSDLQKLSFSEVDSYAGKTKVFDYNGVALKSVNDDAAIYKVTMKSLAPSYPGAERLSNIRNQFKQVEITVKPAMADRVLYVTTIPVANHGYEGI